MKNDKYFIYFVSIGVCVREKERERNIQLV